MAVNIDTPMIMPKTLLNKPTCRKMYQMLVIISHLKMGMNMPRPFGCVVFGKKIPSQDSALIISIEVTTSACLGKIFSIKKLCTSGSVSAQQSSTIIML